MNLNEIKQNDKKYYMNTFGDRYPVCFDYGKGINLWDIEGNKYYDFLAGIAVSALGHSHPVVVDAICNQAKKILHCSNYYYIQSQTELAQLIVENSCADKVFFGNSGAEANDAAIKLARLYFKKKGLDDKYEIITLKKSFHGRTLATIAATGQKKYQEPYTPLTPKFINVPINDIDALKEVVNKNTCAIMLEPIQGEGGVNLIDLDYLKNVKGLCEEFEIVLIYDEIQCGMGRTGKLFAYEGYGVEPDIFTLAKALGSGIPIGAVCAKEPFASAFEPGDHGSTFGGNPFACHVANETLKTIINEKLPGNAEEMGNYFTSKLNLLKEKYSIISEVRGKGLMIGIEFSSPIAKQVNKKLFENKYLAGAVGENIIRLLPPLIITKKDIDAFLVIFEKVISNNF